MIDKQYIVDNYDLYKKNLSDRGLKINLDDFLILDKKRIELIGRVEALRQERNKNAKSIESSNVNEKKSLIENGRQLKESIAVIEVELKSVEEEFFRFYSHLPNCLHQDVPVGENEAQNLVVRVVGKKPDFDFTPLDHSELGRSLDLIDTETAGRVAGARFAYLKNELVLLEFALIQHVMKTVTNPSILKKIADQLNLSISVVSFIPVIPPVMIRPEVMQKMGRLEPRDERYHIETDDLYLVGSAEHTMGPMHMDTIFNESELPLRYVGFSTAFRREAGSYGRDLKGIFRVHQFDKIEFESFSLPENSIEEQDLLIGIQEYLMKSIGIPYRVVMKCTGDMGLPDFREYDIEAWLPGQNTYRETHTSDLMTDYQSRRLSIKVRRSDGRVEFVHMNDATVFALGRTLIAIMENYQEKDGSIRIPEVLREYVGKDCIKK